MQNNIFYIYIHIYIYKCKYFHWTVKNEDGRKYTNKWIQEAWTDGNNLYRWGVWLTHAYIPDT